MTPIINFRLFASHETCATLKEGDSRGYILSCFVHHSHPVTRLPIFSFTLTLFIGPMLLSFWIMPLSICTRTLPVCPGDVHLNCALEMHLPFDSDPGNISSWGLSPNLPVRLIASQNLDIMSLKKATSTLMLVINRKVVSNKILPLS